MIKSYLFAAAATVSVIVSGAYAAEMLPTETFKVLPAELAH